MRLNRLRKIRDNCALTQQQVANALGIERSTYSNYETGNTEPSMDTLRKIILLFDAPLEEIYPRLDCLADDYEDYNGQKSDMSMSMLKPEEQELILKLRLLDKESKEKILSEILDIEIS